MATYKGVNQVLLDLPNGKVQAGEYGGEVKMAYDEFTFTAELANNDVIDLGINVPIQARIINARLLCPDLGGTVTLDLGIAADSDSLIAAADCSGQAVFAQSTAAAVDLGKKLTAEQAYQLKANAASATAVGKKVQVWIEYVKV